MKPLVRIAFVVCAAVFLAACGMKKAEVTDHQVIEVPDGKDTKSISLRKIVVKLPRGTECGDIKAGWACLTHSKMIWRSGKKNISDEDFSSVFIEELKRSNYNVLGDTSNLFEDKTGNAEIAVGGLITSLQHDVCYPAGGFGNFSDGTSVATLTVEWQVYSTLDKKILYRKSANGSREFKFTNNNTTEAIVLAFADAVRGLLADKKFNELVVEKAPTGTMGGLTDGSVTRLSQPSPAAAGGVSVHSKKNKPLSMAEVKQRVVVIQVPGAHGSGFLVGDDGLILTNHHVVSDNKKVRIIYPGGAQAEGVVLKSDPRQDVALVKVESPPVVGLECRVENLEPGLEVYAIGAPFKMALQGSLSKGIVSGYRTDQKGRWLQSDVTINGGNSGGPLVDAQGRVVGMCSSGIGETNTGVNFFVPIADALRVMDIASN